MLLQHAVQRIEIEGPQVAIEAGHPLRRADPRVLAAIPVGLPGVVPALSIQRDVWHTELFRQETAQRALARVGGTDEEDWLAGGAPRQDLIAGLLRGPGFGVDDQFGE